MIRDKTRNRTQLTPRERAFLAELHCGHEASLDKEDALRLASGVFEWHLTASDVDRLECEGREQRRSGRQAPDLYALSQLLWVIGAILDQKRVQSFNMTKEAQNVILEYERPGGKNASESYDLATLYDFWVGMYKKRAADGNSTQLSA